tara:strand:+ start:23 stop:397 length:375 start_codon:yes stop_codon:yes gene_type:complete
MPRKGKGQKIQTATNQEYGQALAQEKAQGVVPLPQMETPQMPVMRPGEMQFNRPTERPNESVKQPASNMNANRPAYTERQRRKIANLVPFLERVASDYDAPVRLRNVVRDLQKSAGPLDDLLGE